ncbi:MAG: FAD-dependent oxidoreductase [Proteobacteria bacterium]|nr:FAD-dependent oxidoreductase [Pseudomonadota bacterium]
MRCVVVGGGIVGICSALTLQRDGHEVIVVDHSGPGEGASKGNAGIFATSHVVPIGTPGILRRVPKMLLDPASPLSIRWSYLPRITPWLVRLIAASTPTRVEAISRALAQLLQRAIAAYAPLLRMAGAEAQVQHRGWLMLFQSHASFAAAEADMELRRRRGVRLEVLDDGMVRQLVPGLRPGELKGVMLPDCRHTVDPYQLTRSLAESFIRQGGQVARTRVEGVEIGPDRRFLATEQGKLGFEALVVAAGAWSRSLVRNLGDDAPLDTERGYHVMLENTVDLRQPLVSADNKFSITPMTDGIRLGGTIEFGGLDAPPNPRRWELMVERARELLPGLKPEKLATWMGFRPSLPDSLPVIGPSPRQPQVFYAFGHGHLGLTLGAVTGQAIADLVNGREPAFDLAPYSISRF